MVLDYYTKGAVAYFILNRPEKHNAITPEMMEILQERMMEFMEDDSLRAGIVTGAGEKSFCAGADVKEWLPFVKETKEKPWRIPLTPMRGLYVTKPLIAAVNGNAFGGGGEIALACDIRIASENAKFGWPEPTLGILPRLGGTQRLPRVIGRAKAAEILLTGRRLTAQEAFDIGLVSQIVQPEKLMETAEEWAAKVCRMAPLSVRAIKKCIAEGCDRPLEAGLGIENDLGMELYDTADYEEGRLAFSEKREPRFIGR